MNLYGFVGNSVVIYVDVWGFGGSLIDSNHKAKGNRHENPIEYLDAFRYLEYEMKKLCNSTCCKIDSDIASCLQQAKLIARSISETWNSVVNDNSKQGTNGHQDNVLGYLCWDWSKAFNEISDNVQGIPRIWDSYDLKLSSKKAGAVTVHYFTRLCACNCPLSNDECCIVIDDGYLIENKYIHNAKKWLDECNKLNIEVHPNKQGRPNSIFAKEQTIPKILITK